MILIIDNYDSFTYNLVQYVGEIVAKTDSIQVFRNDQISVNGIRELAPSHIIISPGPCSPNEAGISLAAISELHTSIPMLGVCLGHQAIAQALGGAVVRAAIPVHGKTSSISHTGTGLFTGVKQNFTATRYHSLIVDEATLPDFLAVTARSETGEIMAIEHREIPTLHGVQFHPESIMTESGRDILANFLLL